MVANPLPPDRLWRGPHDGKFSRHRFMSAQVLRRETSASKFMCFFGFILVMDKTTAQGRSPVEVAQDVLAAVGKKKKDVILADLLPSLAIYLRTLAPGLFFSLMASRARKERKSKNS